MTNPPKEKDTPKEAANELEEKSKEEYPVPTLDGIWNRAFGYNVEAIYTSEHHQVNKDEFMHDILSLIESEKVKARIDECEKIIELLSPGYDYEFWFKIIPDRIKELESKEEAND